MGKFIFVEFREHVKPCCAGFKAQEVGLARLESSPSVVIRLTMAEIASHVDGGEVCGLRFIVIWVVELAETFVDVVSTVLEDNS